MKEKKNTINKQTESQADIADPEEIVGWCLPNVDVLVKKIVHGYASVYPGDRWLGSTNANQRYAARFRLFTGTRAHFKTARPCLQFDSYHTSFSHFQGNLLQWTAIHSRLSANHKIRLSMHCPKVRALVWAHWTIRLQFTHSQVWLMLRSR